MKNEQTSSPEETSGNEGEGQLAVTSRINALAEEGAGRAPVRSTTSVWKRFRRHTLAMIGLIVIAFMTVISVGAPVIAQHGPYSIDLTSISQPPDPATGWGPTPPDETCSVVCCTPDGYRSASGSRWC